MEQEMPVQDTILEAIITLKEQRIVDALQGGMKRMHEIIADTGIGKASLMEALKEMKGMGWIFYSERWQTWRLNPDIKFRLVRMKNGVVVDEEERISVTYRAPLKATFAKKEHERFVDTSLKIGWTTPEEFKRIVAEDRGRMRFIKTKGGEKLNEDYHPDNRAGRASGAGETKVR